MNTHIPFSRYQPSNKLLVCLTGALLVLAMIEVLAILFDRLSMRGVTIKDFDLAAWVQAVGSVLAIAASASLVWWQARNDKLRDSVAQKEKAKRYLLSVVLPIEDLIQISQSICALRSNPLLNESRQERERQTKKIQLALVRLHQVPLFELPSGHSIHRVMSAVHIGEQAAATIDDPSGCLLEKPDGERCCQDAYGSPWRYTSEAMKQASDFLRWELDHLERSDLPYTGP